MRHLLALGGSRFVQREGVSLVDGGLASNTAISQAADLIRRARRATGEWLDTGGTALPHPERSLSLHHH